VVKIVGLFHLVTYTQQNMSNGNLMKNFVKEMSNMLQDQICEATDELEQTNFILEQ